MASDEDNFDIDIYGDGAEEVPTGDEHQDEMSISHGDRHGDRNTDARDPRPAHPPGTAPLQQGLVSNDGIQEMDVAAQKISSTDQSTLNIMNLPRQAPQVQGTERHEGVNDERPVDPGATIALFVSELHWWITDDDVRGWANQTCCEDEIQDISFSEHKINGKSKGQAYILLKSAQAATAMKQRIEGFGDGQQYAKRFAVKYTNPNANPFKTLPKDGPLRGSGGAQTNMARSNPGIAQSYPGGGFRGGRPHSYANRGGPNTQNNAGRGSFGPQLAGFQNPTSGPFGAVGTMQPYNNFQGRGPMINNMRGSSMGTRGPGASMMGMPMNFGMGAMAMGMGMPQMGAVNFSTNGFQGNQRGFNPFFAAQQQASQGYGGADSVHPSKRTRQD